MTYNASELIEKRREKWNELHNIDFDKKFREAVANEILSNRALLDEIKQNPEKLVELVFVVVDKNQKTMPFFFNDVQQEFVQVCIPCRDTRPFQMPSRIRQRVRASRRRR